MPRVEDYRLHPWGWETDPDTERFKLSTFDFLSTTTWTINALFFRVTDDEKPVATRAIREGLERTFSQIRHYVGTIEQDEDGGYSVIKKKDSTVKFVVQHLDGPEDNYPTFDDIAEAHYLSPILGDVGVLINKCMVRGNIPEAQPHSHPEICSYKINLIRGGIIFVLHQHHWVNGLTGGFAFHKQLALNCYASFHKTPMPLFDPKWLNREHFGLPGFDRSSTSSEPEVEVAPRAQQNMQLKSSSSLMFHLRKSKAAELKKAATPLDGTRVSTYDATCALMWRSLCKVRAPLYKPGPDYQLLWGQGVSFSKLFKDPPLPAQLQGNLQFDITSLTSPVPQLSLAEVLSKAPLSELALYTRRMTDSVTVDMLFERINAFKRIKNQHDLSILVDSFPPMSILMTDWRSYDLCSLDFGFGRAPGWRHLFCGVPLSLAVVYPPHRGPAGDDEGFEVQIVLETELIPRLLEDPEWSKYFEFRGVDAAEDMDTSDLKPKL